MPLLKVSQKLLEGPERHAVLGYWKYVYDAPPDQPEMFFLIQELVCSVGSSVALL